MRGGPVGVKLDEKSCQGEGGIGVGLLFGNYW